MYVRVAFFSYSLLSNRENKRRRKRDEDRSGITADRQKPGNDELQKRRREKRILRRKK